MADDGLSGGGDEGGQDICTFFASFINQRQQVERLLNWLRESQTACTDSNCFDDINGLPGSELGSNQLANDETYYQSDEEHGPLAIVMCLIFGILTVYAMSLNRDRQNENPLLNKAHNNRSGGSGNRDPPADDHGQFRGRGNDDDQSQPML